MTAARTIVVVGNPRPGSRTLHAAQFVAGALVGREPDLEIDLATLGPSLLDWQDTAVSSLVAEVGLADLVVVASPTYKGTYTGLLKLFLDRFPPAGMSGVAVPLMLGAGPSHALAPELSLRPVLGELGATTVRGLYVRETEHDHHEAYDAWLQAVRPTVTALTSTLQGVSS